MYNYTMVALFLLVELGIFMIMIYILCIISEPRPVEVPSPLYVEDREPTIQSNFGLYVMGVSVFILMCTFGISYYYTGSYESAIIPGYSLDIVSPNELVTDMIRGHSLGVQGPMTLSEYNIVQTMLESQALLDNLAISPIGDLWITP